MAIDPLRFVRHTLDDDQLRRVEAMSDGMAVDGPSIDVRCPDCRRHGYPPPRVGRLVWRERGHWDLFALRRVRDLPAAPRRPKLIVYGPGPATLRCRRCPWHEDWKAATLGKLAKKQGIEPGPGAVIYPW